MSTAWIFTGAYVMFKRKVVIELLVVLLTLSVLLTVAAGLGTQSKIAHADDPTPTPTLIGGGHGGGGITPDGPDCPSQDCPGVD
jgi:hypothetical protein